MRKIKFFIAAGIAATTIAEIALRLTGVLDFPLYTAGPPYGYIPAPNQAGAFLNHNDWAFNEKSMGTSSHFRPSSKYDLVLIGDSIVYGGNSYKQSQKLGPSISSYVGEPVWPIGAGSWAFSNELTYLEKNPSVVAGADEFIFVLNSQDLLEPSVWHNEQDHPTHRPASALIYALSKKFHRNSPTVQLPSSIWREQWNRFRRTNDKPVLIVLYPNKEEARSPSSRKRNLTEPFSAIAGKGVSVLDLGAQPEWRVASYKDAIHPDANTMKLLAQIISRHIEERK